MVGSLLPAAIDHVIQNLIHLVYKGSHESSDSSETWRVSASGAMAADCHHVRV